MASNWRRPNPSILRHAEPSPKTRVKARINGCLLASTRRVYTSSNTRLPLTFRWDNTFLINGCFTTGRLKLFFPPQLRTMVIAKGLNRAIQLVSACGSGTVLQSQNQGPGTFLLISSVYFLLISKVGLISFKGLFFIITCGCLPRARN